MIKIVLTFIAVIWIGSFLVGCSDKNPARANWFSVEKPPYRAIYVSQKHITPQEMAMILKYGRVPFKVYQFNETVGVSLNANAHQSDTESDSDITQRTIK